MKNNRLELSKRYLIWLAMILAGYIYVSVILCGRRNPFASDNNQIFDFLIVLVTGGALFWFGPYQNWLIQHRKTNSIINWAFLATVLFFYLALHWEFVGQSIGVKFSLKSSDLSSLSEKALAVLIFAAVVVAGMIVIHLRWAAKEQILTRYLIAMVGIPILVSITTLILAQSHYVHIHHYCVGVFLFPFFRFRHPISQMAQGFFLGLAVEGVSRWGLDPVWYSR